MEGYGKNGNLPVKAVKAMSKRKSDESQFMLHTQPPYINRAKPVSSKSPAPINYLWECCFVVMLLTISGCGDKDETPKDFFSKKAIGSSSDYGVYYDGNLEDHVATVHGFLDDHKVCKDIVEILESQGKGKRYSCRKLND